MGLLGLLSPVAVRLLQLRDLSHRSLQRLVGEVMEAASMAIITARVGSEPEKLPIQAFCTEVARWGGDLTQSRDTAKSRT